MEKLKMDVFKERLESLFWIVQQIDKKAVSYTHLDVYKRQP